MTDQLPTQHPRNRRPKNWNLSRRIKEFIDSIDLAERFTLHKVYDFLIDTYLTEAETYEAGELRHQVSLILALLARETDIIEVIEAGRGRQPSVYKRKQVHPAVDAVTTRSVDLTPVVRAVQPSSRSTLTVKELIESLRKERDEIDFLLTSLEARLNSTMKIDVVTASRGAVSCGQEPQ